MSDRLGFAEEKVRVKIGDLGTIITGNTPSKKNDEYWRTKDIGFVKPDVLPEYGIAENIEPNEFIAEKARDKARVVGKNSIFVTCIGSIGKIGIADDKEFAFNQQINAIVPNQKVFPKYLAYNLLFHKRDLTSMANAAVVPIINKNQFSEYMIDILPNINHQYKVVRTLDQVMLLLEQRKSELKQLDILIKARFVEMFGDCKTNDGGWKQKPLYAILEDGSNVSYGIVQTGDDVEDGVPVFRPIDIAGDNRPRRTDLKKTQREISDKYKRTLLRGYELLITVRGSVGETFQVSKEFIGCNVGRNIVPLRFDTKQVLYPFMQHLFAQHGSKEILASMTKGIALQGLNMSEFREMLIIIPPIERQSEFISFVNQVDKSKAIVQKSLDELQTLFDSLMQEYFG